MANVRPKNNRHPDVRPRPGRTGVTTICFSKLCCGWRPLWHDGIGLSLYAKRLDRGRFVWPTTVDGVVALTAAQMSYLLEAIDWRNPQHTWRPQSAG